MVALDRGVDRAAMNAVEDGMRARAGFQPGRHQFLLSLTDSLGLSPQLAPLSIYPFRPEICAALICDYLTVVSVIEATAIEEAFRATGWADVSTADHIDLADPTYPPIIRGRVGTAHLATHTGAIQQALVEFVDLKRQAEALKEYALASKTHAVTGMLMLRNEKATWH